MCNSLCSTHESLAPTAAGYSPAHRWTFPIYPLCVTCFFKDSTDKLSQVTSHHEITGNKVRYILKLYRFWFFKFTILNCSSLLAECQSLESFVWCRIPRRFQQRQPIVSIDWFHYANWSRLPAKEIRQQSWNKRANRWKGNIICPKTYFVYILTHCGML